MNELQTLEKSNGLSAQDQAVDQTSIGPTDDTF